MRRIGTYRIVRPIAEGGQAEVVLGEMEGPGGFVVQHALKVLKEPLAGRRAISFPEGRAAIAEARLLAQLAHAHTLSIHGLHEIDGRLVMVLEYVAGRSLATLLDELFHHNMTLPLDHALWIARFVLMALHRAHTLRDNRGQPLRVVHRDISPENVLLGYDGRVKLIDFGIAISRMASRDTRVGMVKGKLEYMSPEQATGVGDIDYRTDIYSWGLVLYEMLTGHQVLMGDFNSALDRARSPTIVPPRHRNRLLPAPVDDLLMTALAPNRRERFGSARDMMLACMELLHSIDSRYSGDEVGEYVRAVLPRAYDADMNVLGGGGTQVLSDAAAVSGAVPPVSKDDTQESSAYVRPADPPKSTTAAGRARRPPPPIPKEAMDLARRIEPVNHQREPYMDPHEGEVRAHGLGSSDTIVQGAPDQPPELSDLLRAIEDIYEGREDADRPDPGSGPRDETQIYKRR